MYKKSLWSSTKILLFELVKICIEKLINQQDEKKINIKKIDITNTKQNKYLILKKNFK